MRGFDFACGSARRRRSFFFIGNALEITHLSRASSQERSHRRARQVFEVELHGMNFIHDSFLKSRVLEHLAVHGALFIVAHALEVRAADDEGCFDWFSLGRNQAAFFRPRFLRLGCSSSAPATASSPAARLGFFNFFCLFLDDRRPNFKQRLNAFVSGFDVLLAIDPRLLDVFGGRARRSFGIDFFRLIDDDALKFGFLVKEIRDV